MENRQVNIGIIGLGTVGTGVARILLEQKDLLETRSGLNFNLKTIAELDWSKERDLDLSCVNCTTNAHEHLWYSLHRTGQDRVLCSSPVLQLFLS